MLQKRLQTILKFSETLHICKYIFIYMHGKPLIKIPTPTKKKKAKLDNKRALQFPLCPIFFQHMHQYRAVRSL